MNQERLFLDTVFIQALLNKNDQYHTQAKALLPRVKNAVEVWVTEAVLIEVGNALSAVNRTASVQFINQCYQTDDIKVVSVDSSLLMRALELYHSRQDKNWGLSAIRCQLNHGIQPVHKLTNPIQSWKKVELSA
jgi:predicted nucleic acid-binding protein